MLARVVLEYSSTVYAIVGLYDPTVCSSTMAWDGRTFYRARSTPRWVLYRPALTGHGEAFHPEQR